jgi:CRISPR/Cas system type I-B associated protein Csh2 (Cas7 group RAMP superfamily)
MAQKTAKKAFRKTAGRVRGPVQLTMAESLHPIVIDSMSITRSMVTNEKDSDKAQTMGTKHRIGYALYQFRVFVSPSDAEKSGFDSTDLRLFECALMNLFTDDHASRRGEMYVRKVFKAQHNSKYGNVPAYEIFDRITATPSATFKESPKSFLDYEIKVDREGLPPTVQLTELTIDSTCLSTIGTNTFEPISNRIEYIVFFDVKNGNPNGDPDADDRPRRDPISYLGLVTDVCLKRKIRQFIIESQKGIAHREIFFQEGKILNDLISRPYDTDAEVKALYEAKEDASALAQKILCRQYYDIRAFGAVLSTGDKESASQGEEEATE